MPEKFNLEPEDALHFDLLPNLLTKCLPAKCANSFIHGKRDIWYNDEPFIPANHADNRQNFSIYVNNKSGNEANSGNTYRMCYY